MAEKTKYVYLRYKHARYRLWDKRDIGARDCPKCGATADHLKRIDVQLGFFDNKVTYYAACDQCHHNFAWNDDNLKKAQKTMAMESLWSEGEVNGE